MIGNVILPTNSFLERFSTMQREVLKQDYSVYLLD